MVRNEIVERLRQRDPEVVVQGFDRPNISLEVRTLLEERDKRDALVEHVRTIEGVGIVYVALKTVSQSRLDMMRGFCESRTCRRRFVLTYFVRRPRSSATTATSA